MANPHQHYAHPGPSYYHSPPPPPPYYAQAPVPYYPYPMNAVNGHSPPPHQPSSPRMNGSSARGGYHHPHRGGHHYQHYPYVPPQHYVHPQASPPVPTHPQPNPYSHPPKYAPHLQHLAYAQPFRPSGQYSANSWSQQTLSPLPKQLSMPAQLPSPLPPSDDSPAPPSHQNLLPEPTAVTEQEVAPSSSQPQPQEQPVEPSPAKSPPPLPPASPPPAVVVSENVADTEAETKAADTPSDDPESESSPPSGSEVISAKVASDSAESAYVIWSRKPRNPSKAMGVMISAPCPSTLACCQRCYRFTHPSVLTQACSCIHIRFPGIRRTS